MALVSYSDSEGSASDDDTSKTSKTVPTPQSKPTSTADTPPPFAINRSNPRKIQVKLSQEVPTTSSEDGEPPAKKPRIGNGGGGLFSGFNAMLPPPKALTQPARSETNGGDKKPTRKVFNLKTSAEPAFSREAYASKEEWDAPTESTAKSEVGVKDNASFFKPPPPSTTGSAMLFKPLSVARGPKKKKTALASVAAQPGPANIAGDGMPKLEAEPAKVKEPTKISLFSSGASEVETVEDEEDLVEPPHDIEPDPADYDLPSNYPAYSHQSANPPAPFPSDPNSLSHIASSLNLSASDRRLLLGRNHAHSSTTQAASIVNFNTDTEYSANEELRAAGEVVQHNPVRAIAPGKHSLKQLVSAASGQKEALEESFASGRRNRKEAGSKYGW